MRFFRPGFFARLLYPEALFRIKRPGRVIFLTFDDGPSPGSTQQLLAILRKHDIKALFFCTGRNAEKHPDLVDLIRASGHITGNHGYNHPDGFKTSTSVYIDDAEKASALTSGIYFRPPYGHLKLSQYRILSRKFRIIMWDLMPYDYDKSFAAEDILKVMKKEIRPGSILVLHDTPESKSNLVLEDFIEFAHNEGYRFSLI